MHVIPVIIPTQLKLYIDNVERTTSSSTKDLVSLLRHSFGVLCWKNAKQLTDSISYAESRHRWVVIPRTDTRTHELKITWITE